MRALIMAVLLATAPALAHDVMGTVCFVDLGKTRAHLELELPLDQLALALGGPQRVGVVELPESEQALTEYTLRHLAVRTEAGDSFTLSAAPAGVVLHDDRNWLKVELEATPPEGASAREFVLDTDVITHQVVSHRIFVFLRHDLETGLVGDAPVYLDTLHYQRHLAHVHRDPGTLATGFAAVFRLGLSHIAEGSDHLLFLFTLLLPAGLALGARRRWGAQREGRESAWAVLRIVTAFTLGHSATLLVGALGLARVPSAVVESLIAASILVSAAHALVPIFPRREAWVAFSFGLVHGLGFASALDGLGVDGPSLALTVLGFNLGVEVMQAALVLVTLPSLFVLQGTWLGPRLRQLGAAGSFVLALGWLAKRALELDNPLPRLADQLFSHGAWIIVALGVLALLARFGPHQGLSQGTTSA